MIDIISPTQRLPPVDRCIYCATATVPLHDEHIVPYALGGTLVLPKASCARCADVTKKIEQICARRIFGAYRIKTNMPTRRPKQRPSDLPLDVVTVKGDVVTITVGLVEHPSPLAMLVWGPPGHFQSGLPGAYIPAGARIHFPDPIAIGNILSGDNSKGVSINFRNIRTFARMLAKIAYSLAIATRRVNIATEADLVKFIHDEAIDYLPFIGGDISDKKRCQGSFIKSRSEKEWSTNEPF